MAQGAYRILANNKWVLGGSPLSRMGAVRLTSRSASNAARIVDQPPQASWCKYVNPAKVFSAKTHFLTIDTHASFPNMLEWLFNWFQPHSWDHTVTPPVAAPTAPSSLPYASSRVLLMKQTDAPFMNDYWDYPTRSASMPELIFSDKLNHVPLFSSKDQMVSSVICPGKLYFTRSLHPEALYRDPDGSVLTKPTEGSPQVISKVDPQEEFKCATDMMHVNFRIGGSGPGGPEMSHKLGGGSLESDSYKALGPHFIGRSVGLGKNAFYCVEPSTMDARDTRTMTIYAPGVEREGIIKTG